MIHSTISEHPSQIISKLQNIKVFENFHDFRDTVEKSGLAKLTSLDMFTLKGLWDYQHNSILLNASTGPVDKETIDHEIGHAVLHFSSRAVREAWEKAHIDPSFDKFTNYSKTNYREAFAESYMAFIASKGRASSPQYKRVFIVINRAIKSLRVNITK